MVRIGWRAVAVALWVPAALGVGGCGQDVEETTGTNSLTVEVVNLVGAQGSELSAEMSKNVDYGHRAPVWTFLSTTVDGSPFSFSDTVANLPEGEFDLAVVARPGKQTDTADAKGQGCEMSFLLGRDESVAITIDGLHAFGDKGYGPCAATVTRK